jgi:hypothetical protein
MFFGYIFTMKYTQKKVDIPKRRKPNAEADHSDVGHTNQKSKTSG